MDNKNNSKKNNLLSNKLKNKFKGFEAKSNPKLSSRDQLLEKLKEYAKKDADLEDKNSYQKLLSYTFFFLFGSLASFLFSRNPNRFSDFIPNRNRNHSRANKSEYENLSYANVDLIKNNKHELIVSASEYNRYNPKVVYIETSKHKLSDSVRLYTKIFISQKKTNKWVILLHGLGQNHWKTLRFVKLFKSFGYNVLAYDARAHGYSGGSKTTLGYLEKEDLRDIVNYLLNNYIVDSIGLLGTSMGAITTYEFLKKYLYKFRHVKWAIVDSAPTSFSDLFTILSQENEIKDSGTWNYNNLRKLNLKINNYDLDEISPISNLELIKNFPLLIVHSKQDKLIPFVMGTKLFSRKKQIDGKFMAKTINFWPEASGHIQGVVFYPDEYKKKIKQLFNIVKIQSFIKKQS